ncbi:MAG: DUF4469 domain-containing protein [Treponema sp.]|jgi:uncharacterized protein (DUF2141 family)|nr:DUF4469 domain-containing protein [Treponema sp.]
MALINDKQEILHRIHVKLYPSFLPGTEGKFIGRTDDEASLSIEQVCVALKTRGGFTGNYDDLVDHTRQFFDEAAYQIADGFSVNMGYFSIHPRVGGLFENGTAGHSAAGHPISFTFRVLQPLRDLAQYITVEIEGLVNVQGYINEVIDTSTAAVNETLTPGGIFVIEGHKLKVVGTDASVGIYFIDAADETRKIKVMDNLAVNIASKLVGMIPPLTAGAYKVEIITRYGGGGKLLKEPRTITTAYTLTVA